MDTKLLIRLTIEFLILELTDVFHTIKVPAYIMHFTIYIYEYNCNSQNRQGKLIIRVCYSFKIPFEFEQHFRSNAMQFHYTVYGQFNGLILFNYLKMLAES